MPENGEEGGEGGRKTTKYPWKPARVVPAVYSTQTPLVFMSRLIQENISWDFVFCHKARIKNIVLEKLESKHMAISKTKQMKWKYVKSCSKTNKMFLYFCFEAKNFAFQRKLKEFCILFSLSALFFIPIISVFTPMPASRKARYTSMGNHMY